MSKQPRVPRRLTLEVYVRYGEEAIYVRPQPLGERHLLWGGTIDLFLVHTRDSRIVEKREICDVGREALPEVVFTIPEAPFSAYTIAADLVDRHGHRFAADILMETAGEEPEWFGSWEAVDLEVPAPWSPLECRRTRGGLQVACWGREYAFGASGLLHGAQSQGRSLLLEPARVKARVDGEEVSWKRGRVFSLSTFPDQVAFVSQISSAAGLGLTARTEVDFDGMVRVDWQLGARRPLRLEELEVEFRLPEEVGRYFYYMPKEEGKGRNAGQLDRKGHRLDFKYYVWLGDEEVGFSWFTDKDESWIVGGRKKPVQIAREDGDVVLRLRLVSRPVELVPADQRALEGTRVGDIRRQAAKGEHGGMLSYSFGFQATPIKPVLEDAWDYRMFCIQQNVEGSGGRLQVADELLDRLVKSGVRSVTLFEHWADAEGYVSTPHMEALQGIVERCHARGLKILLYFGFLASDLAPEWKEFGKDSIIMPKGGYPIFLYDPQPAQAAWRVCLNSPWQDLLVHGMAETLDRFGVDGVYLDGTEAVFACSNTEHDCGSLHARGMIAPSYPIFGVRTAMRRIHRAVKTRRPNGQVFVHNSGFMTMPTLGWATTAWDGEQFQGGGGDSDVAQLLPMDFFRTEFVGRQWGVATEFLLAGGAYTYEEACGIALLHDVPVKPMTVEQLKPMAAIWKVMDDFDRKGAAWYPYWTENSGVRAGPGGVYASFYNHPDNGLLVVLASMRGREREVWLEVDLRRFQLEGARAVSAVDGCPLPLSGGRVLCRFGPFGWQLIRFC